MGLKENWRLLAQEMGFAYKPGVQAYVDTPRLISMVGREIHLFKDWGRKAAFLNKRMFTMLAEKLYPGIAVGSWQGYECALFPAGRAHATSVTEYKTRIFHLYAVLLFNRPLDLDLLIEGGRGATASLVKGVFRKLLVRFPGSPELDGLVTASARRRGEAEALLSGESVQQGLLELYRASQLFRVTDLGIRHRRQGEIIDPVVAADLLDLMAGTADALSRAAACGETAGGLNGGPGASPSPPA